MERNFYHFKYAPFSRVAPTTFFFASPGSKAVLQAMQHGIDTRHGLVVLISQAGLGKTTLLHVYRSMVSPQRLKIILPAAPPDSFQDLLALLSHELGLGAPTTDPAAMIFRLRQALLVEHKQQRNVACLIDGAEQLSVETLAQMSTLAHLDAPQGKLLQIVLVGRPTLQDKLRHAVVRQHMHQLVRCPPLTPFTKQESEAYIQQRLAQVLTRDAPIFTPAALRRMITYAQGNPGVLNALCTLVLTTGALLQEQPISAKTVQQAVAHISTKRTKRPWHWMIMGGVGGALVLGLLLYAPASQRLGTPQDLLPLVQDALSRIRARFSAPPADAVVPVSSPVPVPAQERSAVETTRVPVVLLPGMTPGQPTPRAVSPEKP